MENRIEIESTKFRLVISKFLFSVLKVCRYAREHDITIESPSQEELVKDLEDPLKTAIYVSAFQTIFSSGDRGKPFRVEINGSNEVIFSEIHEDTIKTYKQVLTTTSSKVLIETLRVKEGPFFDALKAAKCDKNEFLIDRKTDYDSAFKQWALRNPTSPIHFGHCIMRLIFGIFEVL